MAQQSSDAQRAWHYFMRSIRLRCPECGISPIFRSPWRTESITDWFTSHSGCPRCGYAYDREPGYFLFALWMVTFIVTSACGVAQLFFLAAWFDLSTPGLMVCTIFPVVFINIALVRHIKAFYLAIDHFVHPYIEGEEDQAVKGSWRDFH